LYLHSANKHTDYGESWIVRSTESVKQNLPAV